MRNMYMRLSNINNTAMIRSSCRAHCVANVYFLNRANERTSDAYAIRHTRISNRTAQYEQDHIILCVYVQNVISSLAFFSLSCLRSCCCSGMSLCHCCCCLFAAKLVRGWRITTILAAFLHLANGLDRENSLTVYSKRRVSFVSTFFSAIYFYLSLSVSFLVST